MIRNIVLTLGFWLASITISIGCSCVAIANIDTAFHRAEVVFLGKVDRILKDQVYQYQGQPLPVEFINFNILKEYKGVKEGALPLTFIGQQSNCAYPFEEGEEYVVFGYNSGCGFFTTDICTRTTLAKGLAKEDLQRLQALVANIKEHPSERINFIDLAKVDHMDFAIEKLKAENQILQKDKSLLKYMLLAAGVLVSGLLFWLIKRK